ncbi:MAG: DUF2815 family protein [Colwellia sp.]|nr:DUF2815 family protein [Colwellia sp.]
MSKVIDKIMTPKFRVSFPAVFEPKAATEGGKEKYSVVMLFDKSEDLSKLKDLIKRTVEAKYPTKEDRPEGFTTPIKDGDEKSYDGYQGCYTCTASSQYPPGVIDESKTPIINQKEFYAGCYAIATVNAYCWSYMGKSGVSVGLQNIMKINDGESLAGGASAASDFAEIVLPEDDIAEVVGGGTSILD